MSNFIKDLINNLNSENQVRSALLSLLDCVTADSFSHPILIKPSNFGKLRLLMNHPDDIRRNYVLEIVLELLVGSPINTSRIFQQVEPDLLNMLAFHHRDDRTRKLAGAIIECGARNSQGRGFFALQQQANVPPTQSSVLPTAPVRMQPSSQPSSQPSAQPTGRPTTHLQFDEPRAQLFVIRQEEKDEDEDTDRYLRRRSVLR